MATLAFAAAGSAIGAGIGGAFLGVSAAAIGQAVGGFIGQQIDRALFGGLPSVNREGPRLDSLDVMTATAGDPLADLSGRVAVAGTVIWATRLRETINTESERVGSGKQRQTVSSTSYTYSASFAVALGEGPLAHWGRVWADGRLLDLSDLVNAGRVRFYAGTETQAPDPLIAATEGAAPAFRGTSYLVFEDLPLTDFGNRVPQIKVEVWGRSGDLEPLIRGVNVIPGTTESGYSPSVLSRQDYSGPGQVIAQEPQNATRFRGVSDWSLSMDLLSGVLPEANTVSLVVAWFGDDLRAGQCRIMPRVEVRDNPMDVPWRAGGLDRNTAPLVSQVNGRPAYGSAPSDASVVDAIRDLKARGKRVVLYPFVMMDIQAGQALPDPSGAGVQPNFPWRGRIRPTAGQSIAAEASAFVNGEWGLRRFITHLAGLAAQAGGVDAILIGSELRGLTMAHAGGGSFPFVDELRSVAADVRAILPAAAISYAADWSEFHSVREGGEVWFHLDPLWSDPAVDFVGIDNYLPLSDWRDGATHADRDDAAGVTSVYDLDYLKGNIEGGEYWDWFYSSDADRAAQNRTPIADLAHGETWVFRQKAIRDWHANAHHNRPAGVRSASPTGWTPGGKPVWFTELGCPAVDKGANQPNVFVSRLSSESAVPHFSGGTRDDYMQRQYLRAWLEWLRDNPGPVAPADVQVWAWDARPFPEFPMLSGKWSDGPDWFLGHWLNGRAGAAPAAEAIRRRLVERHGAALADIDLTHAHGQAEGYAAPGPLGFRDYAAPLEIGLGLQAYEADGKLVFEYRGAATVAAAVALEDMAEDGAAPPFTVTRSALEDVAAAAVLTFRNGLDDYATAAARAVIGAGAEDGEAVSRLPLVLDFDQGNRAAERLLRAARDGREAITLRLPRSFAHLRPGMVLPVVIDGAARPFMVDAVADGAALTVTARSYAAGAWMASAGVQNLPRAARVQPSAVALVVFLDLPLLPGSDANAWDGFAAAHAAPWPGPVALARSYDPAGGFADALALPAPAVIGETVADLDPAPADVWTGGPLRVRIYSGALTPRTREDVLDGRNLLAVQHGGGWEVLRFSGADLVGPREYVLSGLVRGDRGTEGLCGATLPAGAAVVLLDGAVDPVGLSAGDVGRALQWRYGPGSADPATHATAPHTFDGIGLRPFAPAHLSGTDAGGDLVLTWTRRSRLPVETLADTPADPPLGEAAERYRVEIGPAGSPVRVFDVTAPAATYTAAAQAADGIAAPFRVAVAQISETFGPGSWAEMTVGA